MPAGGVSVMTITTAAFDGIVNVAVTGPVVVVVPYATPIPSVASRLTRVGVVTPVIVAALAMLPFGTPRIATTRSPLVAFIALLAGAVEAVVLSLAL